MMWTNTLGSCVLCTRPCRGFFDDNIHKVDEAASKGINVLAQNCYVGNFNRYKVMLQFSVCRCFHPMDGLFYSVVNERIV